MARSVHTDEYRSIIDALTRTRTQAGVTQLELATRIGRPQSFVSKVERGERRLDLLEFCQIAAALGQGPGELLAHLLSHTKTIEIVPGETT